MTERTIHASDERIPQLTLPPGALSQTDRAYDYDVDTDPPNIEPIEHHIRLDFMRGGPIRRDQLLGGYNPWTYDPDDSTTDPWTGVKQKPPGLGYAEASCRNRILEEKRFYEYADNDTILADAPTFLATRIRLARERANRERALRKERKRRENWYRKLIPGLNLYHVLKGSSYGSLIEQASGPAPDAEALTEQNAFVGMVLVSDDIDPDVYAHKRGLDPTYVVPESSLSAAQSDVSPALADYGIDLPAPVLVGEYASGSQYPLIPWGDAITCSCPYKHDKPWRIMCKHELLASVVCSGHDSIFLPVTRGIDIPHRARRFVNPEIVVSHHSP